MENKNNFFKGYSFFLVAVLLLVVSLLSLFLSQDIVYKTKVPVKVVIGEIIGLNAGSEELDFGTLMPGQSATKKLDLENNFQYPLTVRITLDSGNITSLIYGKNNLLIEPNSKMVYNVSLVIPSDATKGFYEGNLIIEFLR